MKRRTIEVSKKSVTSAKREMESQGWGYVDTREHVEGFLLMDFEAEETPFEQAKDALDGVGFTEDQLYALKNMIDYIERGTA